MTTYFLRFLGDIFSSNELLAALCSGMGKFALMLGVGVHFTGCGSFLWGSGLVDDLSLGGQTERSTYGVPIRSLSLLYFPVGNIFWVSIYCRFLLIFDPICFFMLTEGCKGRRCRKKLRI